MEVQQEAVAYPLWCSLCSEANIAVAYCDACSEMLCTDHKQAHKISTDTCAHLLEHVSMGMPGPHDVQSSRNLTSPLHAAELFSPLFKENPPRRTVCIYHRACTLAWWCGDCSVALCSDCVKEMDNRHINHRMLDIEVVAQDRKRMLSMKIDQLILDGQQKQASYVHRTEERNVHVDNLVQTINSVFDDAIWQMHWRKQSFLTYFRTVARVDLHRCQQEEAAIDHINASLRAIQSEIESTSDVELMMLHQDHIHRRLQEIAHHIHEPARPHLFKNRHFVLDPDHTFAAAVCRLGTLSDPSPSGMYPMLIAPGGIAVHVGGEGNHTLDGRYHRVFVADSHYQQVLVFDSADFSNPSTPAQCILRISAPNEGRLRAATAGDDPSGSDPIAQRSLVPEKVAVDATGTRIVVGYRDAGDTIVFGCDEGKPLFRLRPALDLTVDARRGHVILLLPDQVTLASYSILTGAPLSTFVVPTARDRGQSVLDPTDHAQDKVLAITYDRVADAIVCCCIKRIIYIPAAVSQASHLVSSPFPTLTTFPSSASSSLTISSPPFAQMRELVVDQAYHHVAAYHPYLFVATKDLRVIECWRWRRSNTGGAERLAPMCGLLGRGGGMVVLPSALQLLVTSRMSPVPVVLPFPD